MVMPFFFTPFLFFLPIIGIALVARALSQVFRTVLRDEPEARVVNIPRIGAGLAPTRTTESRVFSLAYHLGGWVTLSDVVMETGLGLADAETLMDRMVDELHVRMTIDEEGLVIYEFPEVIHRLGRESHKYPVSEVLSSIAAI